MSSSKVFVGGAISFFFSISLSGSSCEILYDIHLICIAGLSYNTDEQSLRESFDKYGEVIDGKIIKYHDHIPYQSLNNVILSVT